MNHGSTGQGRRAADAAAADGNPVIIAACRTAIGTLQGGLSSLPAWRLGEVVIGEALARAGLGPESVDEVIMGNVLQAGQGMGPARQAAIAAGLPVTVPAMTINKVCGSSLKAVILASQAVILGDAQVVVAGGMESMSRAPYLLPQARSGYRLGTGALLDSAVHDGLWCSVVDTHMGITAENLAQRYGIDREAQDRLAVQSQARAAAAIEAGRFATEIVPVEVVGRRGDTVLFDRDEHPRPGTSLESLGGLRPAFVKDGTVTAGNASGVNDGAAAVVVAGDEWARREGLPILAKVVSYATVGVEPAVMGIGPVDAVRRALDRAGLAPDDIGLWELNEAFAVQALAVLHELKLDPAIVNVNGGAVALGHPIGASGARVLVTLLHEMAKRQVRFGAASLCIGGGMGVAMVVERAG